MLENKVREMVSNYNTNKDEDEFLEEVINFLKENHVPDANIQHDYDSIDCGPAYTANIHSLAWIDDEGIHLVVWRIEYC